MKFGSFLATLPERAGRTAVFVLEAGEEASLGARIQSLFPTLAFKISPVFPGTPEEPCAFFQVSFLDRSLDDLGCHPADVAYDLEDALGLLSADAVVPGDVELSSLAMSEPVSDPPGVETDENAYEWHLSEMGVYGAWDHAPSRGKGVLVGQPDTGIADHRLLDGTGDRRPGMNVKEPNQLPIDPLLARGTGDFPGHGTAVAGVVASRGLNADKPVRGVSEALALAIRFDNTIVLADDNGLHLARAIDVARNTDCAVISMSLGGAPVATLAVLWWAIWRAAWDGRIMVAAAGQYVVLPVFPALDPHVLGATGSSRGHRHWETSCRGVGMAVASPAEKVWVARRTVPGSSETFVDEGIGTSYSTAGVAGVAALWVAHHGRENLIRTFGRAYLGSGPFKNILQKTAFTPYPNWPRAYGPGIVNAEGVVRAPLVQIEDWTPPVGSAREVIRDNQRAILVDLLQADVVAALPDELVARFGRELVGLAWYARYTEVTAGMGLPDRSVRRMSERLAAALSAEGHDKLRQHLVGRTP